MEIVYKKERFLDTNIVVFCLRGRESRIKHEFAHTNDGVKRRANFVAHVGRELTFGLAGRLRRFLGLPHLTLTGFPIRDVAGHGDRSDDLAYGISQWGRVRAQPHTLRLASW